MARAALKSGYELHNGASCYVIDSVLGKGGFGITYKAYSTLAEDDRKRYFAVKEFFVEDWCERNEHTGHVASTNPTKDKFENGKRDFFSEAKRLSQVSHSNIVKVYDVFEENNTIYYVMECLEGESLDTYLKAHGSLAETQALALMKPIFDAVEVLHANNMTHLDIKPANIMLKKTEGGDSVAVLIDFGLAKHYDTDGNPTTTLRQSGYSDGYSPIEQYSGIATFSPQSDVYALAATLFHCLTGHRPSKSTELTEQELEEQLSASVSGNVKDAIVKAMRMSKKSRTQSVTMVIDELYKTDCTQPVSIVSEEPSISEESQPTYYLDEEYEDEAPGSRGKILRIIFIVIALVLIGWFCYDYMQDGASSNAEAMRQDSIAKAESLAKARQDSIRQESIRRDSIRQDSMWRYRVTPDLATFDLHGPVKSVSSKKRASLEDGVLSLNVSFSESGNVQRVTDGDVVYTISRDAQGRIKTMTCPFLGGPYTRDVYSYKYNDAGSLQKETLNANYDGEGTLDISREYDSNGNIVKEKLDREGDGGGFYSTSTYKITQKDEYGNWIKRAKTIKYKDEIAEEFLELNEDTSRPSIVTGTKTVTETRTITYYSKK